MLKKPTLQDYRKEWDTQYAPYVVVWPHGCHTLGWRPGYHFPSGAGSVYISGAKQNFPAYKVAFGLAHNINPLDIPTRASDGTKLDICHNCGNAACVNPSHLRHDTTQANMHDKLAHGTGGKLTADEMREIKRRYLGGERQATLAHEFGISQPTVSYIVNKWSDPLDWYPRYGHELIR